MNRAQKFLYWSIEKIRKPLRAYWKKKSYKRKLKRIQELDPFRYPLD